MDDKRATPGPTASGAAASLPKFRTKTPPRTLPSQLDESSPVFFDSRPPVPFSPTSPVRSPGRPKTMKDYEEELVALRRENFNLKIRIYFIEQSRVDSTLPKEVVELRNMYTDLKIEFESQKKDLDFKEDLLIKSYRALEVQKQQIEDMKTENDARTEELETRIKELEKELKEYQVKFMETSVQLDDTNALYALTFGLNKPSGQNPADDDKNDKSEDMVTKLSQELEGEKDRASRLEAQVTELNTKCEADQENVCRLHDQVVSLEDKLKQAVKEQTLRDDALKEAATQTKKLMKHIKKLQDTVNQKEAEVGSLKTIVSDLEQRLTLGNKKLQEREQAVSEANSVQMKLQKQIEDLITDNHNLHSKVRALQQQSGRRSGSVPEDQSRVRELQREIQELQREIQELRNSRPQLPGGVENFVQKLIIDNKTLKKELQELKTAYFTLFESRSTKEEVFGSQKIDVIVREMTTKDELISELKSKVDELTLTINEKENELQTYKIKFQSSADGDKMDLKNLQDDISKYQQEKECLLKELEEKKREVDCLERELKKRTFNLQGLVNTELWNKNREIEKLNKTCDRLQKQLQDTSPTLMPAFVNSVSLGSGLFAEDKENMHPTSESIGQLQSWAEEKRMLVRKVEELQDRLLNTPERDVESQLVQTLRCERDQAERLRKETMNACVLLTNRLQELADFLESLLPFLGGKRRRVVKQAVERSRELSRSLSIAAEESAMQSLHCSAWTDLQPSLYLPLLPDVSTVDFWSGEESQDELFSEPEDNTIAKSAVVDNTQENKESKATSNSTFFKSFFGFDDQLLNTDNNALLSDTPFPICTESSVMDTGAEHSNVDKTSMLKLSAEIKSANIGKIVLASKKKESKTLHTVATGDSNKLKDKEGDLSENETWSEPDRDVSYARMGLKDEINNLNKSLLLNCNETSETNEPATKSPSPRRSSELQRLQRKIRSLEQVNEALRSELVILHKLAPPALTRQDKATSIEMSRQSAMCIPAHLLEEIKNQREKLEASLFHNDYIRRQLETTVSSLRKSQVDDQEKDCLIVRLKEVTSQLEAAECEVSKLKLEKENWMKKLDMVQITLEQSSSDLVEKQCALMEMERKTIQKLKDMEETCSQTEQKCKEYEQKCIVLQDEKDEMLTKIAKGEEEIETLKSKLQNYEMEGKKDKQLQEELNVRILNISQQKQELQRVVGEQEQLLADAERERGELATQLIARDRQVSELQARLSGVEQTEAALNAKLGVTTQQCEQYKDKLRELDDYGKRRDADMTELQSRLDAARFAHSEAVLQYTRVSNDNLRLHQELRRRQRDQDSQHNLNQVERMREELERRVAELEAVNTELETRLRSLDVRPPLSDYETDAGSSVVGSPRRLPPPPLSLPISPHHYTSQRSHDLTSDYLSDQDAALSSPQSQPRAMWFPSLLPPQSQASQSPDLGIESDHGRFSSLETHTSKSTALSLCGSSVKDLVKLEEENTQLRQNLQKTRHALQETLTQLTAANQHKRHYEAQLSAANQQKAKVERAICRQLNKTQSILKKAKVNLEDDFKSNKSSQ